MYDPSDRNSLPCGQEGEGEGHSVTMAVGGGRVHLDTSPGASLKIQDQDQLITQTLLKNSGDSIIRRNFFLQKYCYSFITTKFRADMLTVYVYILHKYVYSYIFICMVCMYILNI